MKLKRIILLCMVIESVFVIGCQKKNGEETKYTEKAKITMQVHEETDKMDVISDYGFAKVYEITRYEEGIENFVPQYQYIVFNSEKTKIIDAGVMNYNDPQFVEISESVVKAEYGTGATDSWKGRYYELKEEKVSKEFNCPLEEFGKNVAYYSFENNKTYLVVSDMFNKKKTKKYYLSNDWLLPSLLKVTYESGMLHVKYDGSGKEFSKEIAIE